jgi:membrane-associated progesterone receptor component
VLPTSKGGAHSHANIEPTPSARRYVEVLQADVEESVELLAVHHMLQYLAVLSGGQFLKTQLSKQMQSESIDDPNDGLTFYTFASIGVRGGSKFVSAYMDTFDSLAFTISRQRILECAKQVYALSDALMAECYAVAPVELEPETNTPVKPTEGPMLRLTSAELAEFDGVNQPRILLSIRGKLYDVTAGREMYGPSGSYSKFAGKDVTRALGSMDLSHEALDDLDWQPETSKEEKTLVDWEKKIGGKYPVCGDLIQLVRPRVITGGAAVKNEVTDDGATTEGAAATCPFSGAAAPPGAAGTCPFAGAAEKPAADDKGECPWPFVFLHDVQGGLHPKHRLKNAATVAIVAVVATAVVRYFL